MLKDHVFINSFLQKIDSENRKIIIFKRNVELG